MANLQNQIHELYKLEQLAGGRTFVHRLHPLVKLLSTFIFLITVISFDRYALDKLPVYLFYPIVLMALSGTPYGLLLKRFLLALPFCLFGGISNIVFDRATAFVAWGVPVSFGVISFCAILLRAYLCVMAVLVLVSVTPFAELTGALRRLKVPAVFVTMFEMIYRYLGVLLEETSLMYTAYTLRSAGGSGLEMRHMGSFVGQLLIRSFDRAERVYQAMKCRGYANDAAAGSVRKMTGTDVLFLVVTCVFCAGFRFGL